jgi:hypothetical protein
VAFDPQKHPDIRMLRHGFSFDPDPAAILPEPFAYIVGDAPESWGRKSSCATTRALYPISREFFGEVIQYWMIDAGLYHAGVHFHPFMSLTTTVVGSPARMTAIEQKLREHGRNWTLKMTANREVMEGSVAAEHEAWQPPDL